VIYITGSNANVTSATINGPGAQGLYLGSTNACVNYNIFGVGTGLSVGIFSSSSTNIGSFNVMNGFSSNLTPGTCSDTTSPVISGMPAAGCTLWPPNHKLIRVANVTAADAQSGLAPGSFTVIGKSNEPSDPKNPDIVITSNGSGGFVVQLRADRLGTGTGRVYTVTATASDVAGNVATSTATCTVPHDQGH